MARLPILHKPAEAAPRAGFFETGAFEAVRAQLAPELQVAATIGHVLGWRKGEVLGLERRHLDLTAGTLRLDPGTTKNDDGRLVYLTPELKDMLAAHVAKIEALEREMGQVIPYLFPHFTRRSGKAVGSQRKEYLRAWTLACKRAGYAGMLRHDLRRTAVRNLVNAGVSETVAMRITGHKTRTVFDRHHIVSPGDLQEAARKLAGSATLSATAASVTPIGRKRQGLTRRGVSARNFRVRRGPLSPQRASLSA